MKMRRTIPLAVLLLGAAVSPARAAVIECTVERVTEATYICRDKTGNLFNLARSVGDYRMGDTIRHKTGARVHYQDYQVVAVRAPELVLRDRAGNLITLKEHLKSFREGDLVRYILPGTSHPADYQVVRNVAPEVRLRDDSGKELVVERNPGKLRPGDRVEYDRKRKKLRRDKNGEGD